MIYRKFKKIIEDILPRHDFKQRLNLIKEIPHYSLINCLLGLLYSCDPLIKWRSIFLISDLVSYIANSNIEKARLIMRRLMWNLNDESGGIGWGSLETMGAITAKNKKMADEFSHIVISYINPKGNNFLEYHMLQRGATWAVGQLAYNRPKLVQLNANLLIPFLFSNDPQIRGITAWAVGPVKNNKIINSLKMISSDSNLVEIYIDENIKKMTIKALVKKSLSI